MKSLSKLIAVAFVAMALFFSTEVKAQTTPAGDFRLGFGIETGVPTGNAKLSSTFTLGGTGRLQYGVTNNFAVTLTTGGYHFFSKKKPGSDERYQSYGIIPIKAGIKEFFIPNVYFAAEAGIAFEKEVVGWGPHRFDYTPGIGYANKHWDESIRFEHFSGNNGGYGIVGLRVAYGFGL